MASYSPKLLDKKFKNWVKAHLAMLFTKDGLEPFVSNEIQQFQQKCLDDICYNNGIFSGTICSGCSTENVVKCPTKGICIVGSGQCSFHINSNYIQAGCPNRICHNFKTGIQKAHRYSCPSYKNTDATQWCSNSWEVAKCFMPPDGYKDKASATETDFNGIISVILNYKDFERKVHENLNIYEEAREIGKTVRHSSSLEVEDSDLQNYFQLLQKLLSDPVFLATDTHAQNAKQKLTELENDPLVIGKDYTRTAQDDLAKAVQYDIKIQFKDRIKQELKTLTAELLKRLNEEGDKELTETLQIAIKSASKDKIEEYIEYKQKLKDELITWYNTKMSTVYLSQLTNSFPHPLAGFYTLQEIDKQTYLAGGRKKATRVKSIQDLFISDRKTYLALTWCQAHHKDENYQHFKEEDLKALSGFEFLFLVQMRDSTEVCHVDDMIEQQVIHYLPCSSSMPKGILKDILHDEECLVILDGLDKWTHPDNDCTRLPKFFPHRYAREKCVILTTTRPW